MLRFIKLAALAGAASLLPASASAAQLIQNGGFELPLVPGSCCTTTPPDPLPGWTVTAGDVNVVIGTFGSTNGNLAFEGSQYLDLVGEAPNGALQQTFSTLVGRTYSVSFAYSHNLFGGAPSASGVFAVDVLGGTLTHTGGTTNNLGWITYTGTFVASGTSATIAFSGSQATDNAGLFLDAVSVTGAVPEPATWAMLILGMGLVGGAMRRQTARRGRALAKIAFS
jgi:hypothetical protein